MALMLGFLFGLIRMFIPLIVEQGQNLALLDIDQLQGNIENLYQQAMDYFSINNIDVEQSIKDSNLLSNTCAR